MWRFINYINAKYDYNVTKNKYCKCKTKIKYCISFSYFPCTLLMLKETEKSIK